jgi:alkylation response protein AidB-like acyl-CoA dehydrogenase
LALSAEAIGIMVALNRMTSEYLQIRRQFGVPLASFQVLQHRLVDMAIEEQQSIALVQRACQMADAEANEALRLALAARAFTARAARRVAEEAVQLHGGIGMTEELAVGRYLRRALAVGTMLGGVDDAFGRLIGQPQRPWYGETLPLKRMPDTSNQTPATSELAAIAR